MLQENPSIIQELKEEAVRRTQAKKADNAPFSIATWDSARAGKDQSDRERLLEKVKDLPDHPSKIQADFKGGKNQYLTVDIDTSTCQLTKRKSKSKLASMATTP